MAKLDASSKNGAGLKVAQTDDEWDEILGSDSEDEEEADDGERDPTAIAVGESISPIAGLRTPCRVRLLSDIETDNGETLKAGEEHPVIVDQDGDVWIVKEGATDIESGFNVLPEEYEVIAWEGGAEVSDGNCDGVQSVEVAAVEMPTPATPTPQPVPDAQAEYESKLRNAQDWLLKATLLRRNCELQLERAKSALKDSEEEENSAADRVEKIMAEGPALRELFDKAAPPQPEEAKREGVQHDQVPVAECNQSTEAATEEQLHAADADQHAAGQSSAADNQEDQSWREVNIKDLPLPMTAALVGALAANPDKPIHTMGDLSDWTAMKSKDGFQNPLCEIPKIGKGKAEKIQEALDKFWATWPKRLNG